MLAAMQGGTVTIAMGGTTKTLRPPNLHHQISLTHLVPLSPTILLTYPSKNYQLLMSN